MPAKPPVMRSKEDKMRDQDIPTLKTGDNSPEWWLRGTTCSRQKNTIFRVSKSGRYAVFKHQGHGEWCGGSLGNLYCATLYALFDMKNLPSKITDTSRAVMASECALKTWEGRWTKARQAEVELLDTAACKHTYDEHGICFECDQPRIEGEA